MTWQRHAERIVFEWPAPVVAELIALGFIAVAPPELTPAGKEWLKRRAA